MLCNNNINFKLLNYLNLPLYYTSKKAIIQSNSFINDLHKNINILSKNEINRIYDEITNEYKKDMSKKSFMELKDLDKESMVNSVNSTIYKLYSDDIMYEDKSKKFKDEIFIFYNELMNKYIKYPKNMMEYMYNNEKPNNGEKIKLYIENDSVKCIELVYNNEELFLEGICNIDGCLFGSIGDIPLKYNDIDNSISLNAIFFRNNYIKKGGRYINNKKYCAIVHREYSVMRLSFNNKNLRIEIPKYFCTTEKRNEYIICMPDDNKRSCKYCHTLMNVKLIYLI